MCVARLAVFSVRALIDIDVQLWGSTRKVHFLYSSTRPTTLTNPWCHQGGGGKRYDHPHLAPSLAEPPPTGNTPSSHQEATFWGFKPETVSAGTGQFAHTVRNPASPPNAHMAARALLILRKCADPAYLQLDGQYDHGISPAFFSRPLRRVALILREGRAIPRIYRAQYHAISPR